MLDRFASLDDELAAYRDRYTHAEKVQAQLA